MTQPLNKQEETKSVPLRQFSLYRPPYEELYSFWWKCMQITLHDKGTQTLNTGPGPDTAFLKNKVKDAMDTVRLLNTNDPISSNLSKTLNAMKDELVANNAIEIPSDESENKTGENEQIKQLMAMVNYYNTVGKEGKNSNRVSKTFRGAGVLAPGLNPSMLGSFPPTPTDGTPVMEKRAPFNNGVISTSPQSAASPTLTPTSNITSPILLKNSTATSMPINTNGSSTVATTTSLPSLVPTSVSDVPMLENSLLQTPSCSSSPSVLVTTSPVLSSAAAAVAASNISFSAAVHLLPSLQTALSAASKPVSTTDSADITQQLSDTVTQLTQSITAPKVVPSFKQEDTEPMVVENGLCNTTNGGNNDATVAPTSGLFQGDGDQISDLINIKQLTDVLGRKAVLDSLNSSSPSDLSSYLGSITMAQAASILGQLPSSTSTSTTARNLLNSLCIPLYNMDNVLKTDSMETNCKTESNRHYQAEESDTSNITLPEGFEVEEHLTWSEVESFVNEFKTKRVKLGYTQAHVGAALALVHGPEFSQTTISRFEGLQLSFQNHKKIIPILRRWLESVENPAKRRTSPNTMNSSSSPNHNSKRRKRTTISSNSKEILEQYYQTNPLPTTDEISNLSNNLALDKRVIRIWFQNRRAIGKRLSKLIVTMGGGASKPQNGANSLATMTTMQQQLY